MSVWILFLSGYCICCIFQCRFYAELFQTFSNGLCWQVWDVYFTLLYFQSCTKWFSDMKYWMWWNVLISRIQNLQGKLYNLQRLDMYGLFVVMSILKVSWKYINTKWFESHSLLCFSIWFTSPPSISAYGISLSVPVHRARQHRNMHGVRDCGLLSNYLLWTPISM